MKPSSNSKIPLKEKCEESEKEEEEEASVEESDDDGELSLPAVPHPTQQFPTPPPSNEPGNMKEESSSSSSSSSSVVKAATSNEPPLTPPTEQLTFAQLGLCHELIAICEQELLWKLPTPIQQQVIPYAIGTNIHNSSNSDSNDNHSNTPQDIIALAQTGSGKTGAFLLPIFHNLLTRRGNGTTSTSSSTTTTTFHHKKQRGSAVLILTPTRELAVQIYQVVQAFTHGIGVTGCCIVGGVDRVPQALALMQYPHVIIATPGRFVDHLKDTKGFSIQHSLQYLVLDEADRMLSMDFEQELHTILDVIPTERQTMLFSATMTSQVQKLQRVSLKNSNHVQRVEVSTKFQTPASLLQYYLFIPAKYKDIYLTYLLNDAMGKSIIVFSATCNNTQRLAILLRNLNFPAVALHGQLPQNARLGCLQKFMSGQRSIMICTDVASRGLDIPNVDMVINYDLPNHGKEYIHRVGRTARAGKSGQAISFVTQYDVEIYQRIELLLGYPLPSYMETHPQVQEETVLIFAERVNEAQRLATRELKEQLANGGFGGNTKNHKRRKNHNNNNNDQYDTEEGGGGSHHPAQLQHQIQQKYRGTGGSGNKGGALPNQRGSGRQNKKYKHHK